MKLRLKFNLVLGLASIIGILVSGLFTYQLLQENAREEILDRARIMMQSAIAVRGYTVKEVRPLLALQQKRQFIKQTVPAYAAHQFIAQLQTEYPDYAYKEATLNPTNPADRAKDWEADLVEHFRTHGDVTELIGERDAATGRVLYLSKPIKITNPACLTCHSTPAAAPDTLIETYGNANGFGWQLNEIVGAQVVTVPMEIPLQRAQEAFTLFMASLVGVFVLIAILLNVMLNIIVIKPVRLMSEKANQVSMGGLETEELTIKGNDEIASLGQSFNRMHRSLQNAVNMLDETMD